MVGPLQKKNRLSHKNIAQQLFVYTNILSRGYPTKLNNYENSRGMGGLKQKRPPWEDGGGGGGMDIFWDYTLSKKKNIQ